MESIDDPLTDSQKSSTNTTNTTLPTPPTSQHLHSNPGPAKAGSDTSSCRAPQASWRQRGLITKPQMGKQRKHCSRDRAVPGTLDKLLAVKHPLYPVTGSSGSLTAPSCYLSLGQNVVSTLSPAL
ncbi:chemokine-like protein TAFA-5a isoform X1 [Xyrichtys novacula]|uniref:Chemokine-like protein TAFA-5a isoform X1 n=1 Tax=Xyrichtys novacula TaxID=13765 RepID=A0AAV1F2C7_XYRNO|nr:chemokine-like protein TAFA-5a isoform X1 [Xyrichtys novacula]